MGAGRPILLLEERASQGHLHPQGLEVVPRDELAERDARGPVHVDAPDERPSGDDVPEDLALPADVEVVGVGRGGVLRSVGVGAVQLHQLVRVVDG